MTLGAIKIMKFQQDLSNDAFDDGGIPSRPVFDNGGIPSRPGRFVFRVV